MDVPKRHTFKRDEEVTTEMERPVHDKRNAPAGSVLSLSSGRAAHNENLKPHVPSPEDWSVPQNIEGLEYLLVEPACESNEKGTSKKNDGNENMSMEENEKNRGRLGRRVFRRRGLEQTRAERGAKMDRTRSTHDDGNKKEREQEDKL